MAKKETLYSTRKAKDFLQDELGIPSHNMGTWQVEKYFDFVKYSGKTKFWIKRLSIVPEVIGEETRLEQLIPTVQEDQTLECDSRFAYMYRGLLEKVLYKKRS